ncbi:MAG TPA: trimethylamine methyltransferase family protein [Atribacteraceae bacterium]|nr:trimethylamine methyltransferase family protein [Atribacteraceae bacterium]
MKLNRAEVLSREEIHSIHEASLRILDERGVIVLSDAMRKLFGEKGLPVDHDSGVVRIPPSIVERSLQQAPSSFPLFTVDGHPWRTVGEGEPLFACGHNAVFMLDRRTGQRRESLVQDVEDFVCIADQLAEIDLVGIPVMPQDTPAESTLLYAVKAAMTTSKKPVFFSSESAGINRMIIRMAHSVNPGVTDRPFLVSQLSPTSPLYWEKGAIEALFEVCRAGIPLAILPEPIAGVSAPHTLAGLLTMHNTECLSGIVFSQLIREKTPVIYASSWTAYDMRANMAVIGTPETDILRIAGAQMAAFYQIPSHTTAPNADSHVHDEQNAWERTLSTLVSAQAGNHLIVNAGMFATGLTVSLEQLLLDAEIIGMVRRLMRGMKVDRETIFLDEIRRVGHRGNYFMEESTLRHLRSGEFWLSRISILGNFDQCCASGLNDVVQAARKKVESLLARSCAVSLSPDILRELDRIISHFEEKGEDA